MTGSWTGLRSDSTSMEISLYRFLSMVSLAMKHNKVHLNNNQYLKSTNSTGLEIRNEEFVFLIL